MLLAPSVTAHPFWALAPGADKIAVAFLTKPSLLRAPPKNSSKVLRRVPLIIFYKGPILVFGSIFCYNLDIL